MYSRECFIYTYFSNFEKGHVYCSVVVDLLFYAPPVVCLGSVLVFAFVCITLCPF